MVQPSSEDTPWRDDQIRWTDNNLLDEPGTSVEHDLFRPDPRTSFDYDFDGTHISLQGYTMESDEIYQSTGLTVWRASEHLCRHLVVHQSLLSGDALELGAGLGMVGILASKLTDCRLVITDGDSQALPLLRENVHHNESRASVRQLIWGLDSSLSFLEVQGPFDVILASDIIYVECIIPPLWDTIRTLLKKEGVFVLAFAKRRVPISIEDVLKSVHEAGFAYKRMDPGEDAEGIFIYHITWAEQTEEYSK